MPLDTIMRQLLQQYVADRQYIARLREAVGVRARQEIGEPPKLLEPSTEMFIETLIAYAGAIQELQQKLQQQQEQADA